MYLITEAGANPWLGLADVLLVRRHPEDLTNGPILDAVDGPSTGTVSAIEEVAGWGAPELEEEVSYWHKAEVPGVSAYVCCRP